MTVVEMRDPEWGIVREALEAGWRFEVGRYTDHSNRGKGPKDPQYPLVYCVSFHRFHRATDELLRTHGRHGRLLEALKDAWAQARKLED